ncbi:MAG: efflux RND transporter periplasmic adaptor subunit [Alphaproteobacteria bacterium]|nr:efflux RND transporter periplasmic adaptor subunit [Alphaproteobacteria bacterium]
MEQDSTRPRWRLKHFVLLVLILAGLGSAGRYFFFVPSVTVTHLTRGQAVTAVYASGTVEPIVLMRIAPKLMGRLAELTADEAVQVKAGQVLARLDDQELRANLAQLEARLDLAKREAERANTLLARHTGTVQERDKAQSALQEVQAAWTMADKQRSEYTLVAPADGLIIRRDGEVGELISANQAIFYLAACALDACGKALRITANVDEEDIALVRSGQKVLIRADAFPQQSFEGKVETVTPKGDATERNFRVRIALAPDLPLRIGMSTEINIIIGVQDDAWLLPASAVREGKVWLLRDGRLEQVKVEVGPTNSDKIAIKKGLMPDDVVVVAPEENFKAGQKRRAQPADKKV